MIAQPHMPARLEREVSLTPPYVLHGRTGRAILSGAQTVHLVRYILKTRNSAEFCFLNDEGHLIFYGSASRFTSELAADKIAETRKKKPA